MVLLCSCSPFASQAMIIMAFNELETPLQLFDAVIFEDVSSVFVTSSVLKLLQGICHFSSVASDFDSKSLCSLYSIQWQGK